MERRKLLQSIGFASTHVLFPGILGAFIASCKNPDTNAFEESPFFFSTDQLEFVKELVDIILPATTSKSASEVMTHYFLDEVFAKCMSPDQQQHILEGISTLQSEYQKNPGDLNKLIIELDQRAYNRDGETQFFIWIKQYTLVGFFSSQEGMTIASNYNELPGEYKGDIKMDDQTLNQGKTDLRFYL